MATTNTPGMSPGHNPRKGTYVSTHENGNGTNGNGNGNNARDARDLPALEIPARQWDMGRVARFLWRLQRVYVATVARRLDPECNADMQDHYIAMVEEMNRILARVAEVSQYPRADWQEHLGDLRQIAVNYDALARHLGAREQYRASQVMVARKRTARVCAALFERAHRGFDESRPLLPYDTRN